MANHILTNQNTILQGLFKKLEELKQFNTLFAEYAEPELVKHCQVVKFEKNCLFVIAENGSWATQLRYRIPELMRQLKSHSPLENLSGIICKTRPAFQIRKPSKSKRSVRKLSPKTAEKIMGSAQSIQDKRLRSILQKIASYLK